MKHRSVLIVGCGDLGQRAGAQLLDLGASITGVRRNIDRLPSTFLGRAANYTQPGSLSFAAELKPDYVLAIFNPVDRSVAGYESGFQHAMQNLLSGLGQHRPRHIVMSSSTRVFVESCGGWVDEHSAVTSDDPCALAIIAAEQQLLHSIHAASVVRFAGIYGVPGGRLISRIRQGELCPPAPVSYTNRIHRDDCAGFLVHLLRLAEAGTALEPVYIGVDNEPAPRFEVESWLAAQMGLNQPPTAGAVPIASVQHHSPGHKRCRNTALRNSGYQLMFPDYRSGYGALLAST
jgi:nucleoside-diphosphate-sugar epimerase